MRYLILGLGIYGSNLARDLTDMGHEIIGVDDHQSNIDAIKDYISTVYLIDVTEEAALSLLPLNNVDLVIVTIGENFGASVKVVALLKKLKVKHIYARAIDELHESILHGFDIDRILTPEQRAARDLTYEMALGANAQSLAVDDDNFIIKFNVPKPFVGLTYADINLEGSFGMRLLTVTRTVRKTNALGISACSHSMLDISNPNIVITENDEWIVLGSRKNYFAFFKHIKNNENVN